MPVRGRDLYGAAPSPRAILWISTPWRPRADPLSGSVFAPVGRGYAIPAFAGGARVDIRPCLQRDLPAQPYLPPFSRNVLVGNVRLSDASVDLVVHREGDAVSVEAIRPQGVIRVCVIYDNQRIS